MRHKICFLDLDGTVNSTTDVRAHLVPSHPMYEENWAAWHGAHTEEKPNFSVIRVVSALANEGWKIIILSMRGDQYSKSTQKQLSAWGVPVNSFILKSPGDSRQPAVYKTDEVKNLLIAAYHMQQELDVLVIDDSAEVVDAVRSIAVIGNAKINVLHVNQFKGI